MVKKGLFGIIIFIVLFIGISGSYFYLQNREERNDHNKTIDHSKENYAYINADGKVLKDRLPAPPGYTRTKEDRDGLAAFLRNYKMKKDGSPVLLYDGREKTADVHVAVFRLPLENEDLQQCADSIMRVYGEYYYARGEYGKIRYSLGDGFHANFETWSQGNGIGISGDELYWTTSSDHDSSYDSFKKFMRIVFAYSGTLNLEEDSEPIRLDDIRVGDMFIKGGSPGHVVMVVDLCENKDGDKAFLLAQGYMPAQEFHVIKNPKHEEDPWYYQNEISYPLETAQYTFEEGSLRRPNLE
ncbi:MAG: DUF4846 domain-containing protein [Lachnospiraceae bacterium]|nr:DUF4846 domain-containing protein [Lachnospiraceae bacterium]